MAAQADDDQDGAVLFQRLQHRPHFALVVGQGLVENNLAHLVEGHGVVFALAHINANEHVDAVVVLDHYYSIHLGFSGLVHGVKSRHPRYERPEKVSRSSPY